jgi:hypothetical protein
VHQRQFLRGGGLGGDDFAEGRHGQVTGMNRGARG